MEYLRLGKNLKSGIAWFKLGGWVWQGLRTAEGHRLCSLCIEKDGAEHLLLECPAVSDLKNNLEISLSAFNCVHAFRTGDKRVIISLGNLLLKIKRERELAYNSQDK